jgi:TPR repeat protein
MDDAFERMALRMHGEVLKNLREAAEQGDAKAQYGLGWMYFKDDPIGTQDYAEVIKWWRKAAEQGYAKAQYHLSVMYGSGTRVTQDLDEAAKWRHKAAEQGDEDAQSDLDLLSFLTEAA